MDPSLTEPGRGAVPECLEERVIAAVRRAHTAASPPPLSQILTAFEPLDSACIAAAILFDLPERWRRGQPVTLEEYLACFPQWRPTRVVAAKLLLCEWSARTDAGLNTDLEAFSRRFPLWADGFHELIAPQERPTESLACDASAGPTTGRSTSPPWEPGRSPVLGYRLVRPLGRGGMGEVWEAAGPGGVPLALKRVDLDQPCGEHELKALELLKRVRHPHLLSVHGYWIDGRSLIIGLELADESLRSLLKGDPQRAAQGLPLETTARYLADAAEALDYLARPIHRLNSHAVRIQHRDVKPANLLLQGGAVKLADFGLAKALEDVVQSHTGSMTISYAPPEFFRGQTSAASDQYSLGVTYYELRTGRLPFQGTLQEIIDGHLHRQPDLEGLSEAERRVVARALAKNPEHRWAGCVKFIGEAIRAGQPGTIGTAETSLSGAGKPDETARTYRGHTVSTGLLLVGDELVPLPLKRTELRAAITAATAEASVTQVFVNTHDRALEATYVFPLPEDAAVHRLRIWVGERIIEGVVREKEEARQTYAEAKREGHGAALVEQTTPNIFTSAVANILPGQEIRVEIAYLQPLPFQEGQYRFVFPLVVSPRYVLGTSQAAEPIVPQVPAAITAPRLPQGMLRGDTVSIELDLDAGVPLCGFDSPSHDIVTLEEVGTSRVKIGLRRDDEIPNRDFVLNYRVAGPKIEHGVFYEPPQEGTLGTFLWLSTPPAAESIARLPREIIFVLDRSGSMHGSPIEQAKQAARQLVDRLAPDDTFNVIAFNHEVTPLAAVPLLAEEAHLRRAHAFLDGLQARGGTEMLEPLRLALQQPSPDAVPRVRMVGLHFELAEATTLDAAPRVRMVVFLTDGSVHGERELLAALRPVVGRARIVGFGIGTAVNRHLLNRLTAAGRGFAEYLFPGENIAHVVDRTLRRLSHAVLTDIQLDWEGGGVESVLPQPCPDLYRDQPLMVVGRYRGELPPQATIRGRLGGQISETTISMSDVRRHEGGVPLHALWARQQIEVLMDRIWERPEQREELRKQVIELAIQHRLASEFTSFLAVDYRTAAEREKARGAAAVEIPQYLPQGMPSLLDQVIAASPPLDKVLQNADRVKAYADQALGNVTVTEKVLQNADRVKALVSSMTAAPAPVHQKLSRVRRPRVHITYEVEREGAISKLELPFVVGVLGDLAGTKGPTTVPLGERKFITIDRDNFDDILARWDVRLALEVPDTLSGDGTVLRVGLQFRGLADFSPSAILRQVPALKTLLDVRQKLVERIMRTGEGPTPQAQPPLLDSANPPLRQWLSEDDSPYNRIKAVDQVLSKQLALIMHDARFRRLEGAWRGLHYLVTNTETSSQLKLKVLNVSQEELVEDLNRRKTFEQSEIFKQLYEHEFTVPGGEPFGALVADYEFTNAADDIRLLEQISHIAAAAFCPLLTAASPALLGLRSFAELAEARDLAPIFDFDTVEYANWRSFRDSEDSRFVALTLPRVLARLPYGSQTMPIDEFDFEELGLDSPPAKPTSVHDRCCWMNAAYALAARLTDAFARYGWCTAIRGAEGGGKVEGLPAYIFQSDDGDLDLKCPTEVGITDRRETELSKLGFLPLYHLKNTDSAVFFSASTAHRPRRDDRQEAEEMARVMAQLPHVMATSRFCHYLKVLARDRLGSGQDANDCQVHLDRWLANYVSADPNPSAEAKVRYPLRAAKVELQEVPGQPGTWRAVLWLRLWIVPGDITAPIRVVLRIPHWKGNG